MQEGAGSSLCQVSADLRPLPPAVSPAVSWSEKPAEGLGHVPPLESEAALARLGDGVRLSEQFHGWLAISREPCKREPI